MSRNVIVGLTVLVVAVLGWIVVGRFAEESAVPDAQVDDTLVSTDDGIEEREGQPDASTQGAPDEAEAEFDANNGGEPAPEPDADATADEPAGLLESDAPAGEITDTTGEVESDGEESTAPDIATQPPGTAAEGAQVPPQEPDPTPEQSEAPEEEQGAAADPADTEAAEPETDTEAAEPAADAEAAEPEADAEAGATQQSGVAATLDDGDDTDATGSTGTEGSPDLATLLTPEGFDADALETYVDDSDLAPVAKTGLKTALEQAKGNPDLVPGVIDQLKARLDVPE